MNSPQLCGAQNSTIDRKIHPIDNKMKRSIQGMKNQLSTRQIALQFKNFQLKQGTAKACGALSKRFFQAKITLIRGERGTITHSRGREFALNSEK
ncbi:hypothetical protein [Burkholderia gladioli]|uniref:hypothetical protein n=1 Tax=Burkholderia gladioli TaxID=28095 RepID=UPI001641D522|nr:hypothetical protein [Burkholderia gladioli]